MTGEEFSVWYSGLIRTGLIDTTAKALEGCAMSDNCSNCQNRAFCPIRPFFYRQTTDFNELKQCILTELDDQPEIITFIFDNFKQILDKKRLEVRDNPQYSCEYSEG